MIVLASRKSATEQVPVYPQKIVIYPKHVHCGNIQRSIKLKYLLS